jgi:Na+/proline symporter
MVALASPIITCIPCCFGTIDGHDKFFSMGTHAVNSSNPRMAHSDQNIEQNDAFISTCVLNRSTIMSCQYLVSIHLNPSIMTRLTSKRLSTRDVGIMLPSFIFLL